MDQIQVWRDIGVRGIEFTAEDTAVTLVPVVVLKGVSSDLFVPFTNLVTSLAGDKFPNVGAYVPAAQMMQAPVSLDRRELAVVVVIGVICRTNKATWDSRPQENTGNLVAGRCILTIGLPSDIDEGLVSVEVFILE